MLTIIPKNGITLNACPIESEPGTIMINNFVIHGKRGIGIGRKVIEEWEKNIPEQYHTILLRAKNDNARAFWSKMGFIIENGPNEEGEYWMTKDISALDRDARIPYLFTVSARAEEALYRVRKMGLDEKVEQIAARWLETMAVQQVDEAGFTQVHFAQPPREQVLAAAIRAFPACMAYLNVPAAEHLQYLALATDPCSLWTIEDPSEDLILFAIKKKAHAIEYIQNPSAFAQYVALTNGFQKDCFNVEVLAEFDSLFTKEVLEKVKPGLSIIRSFTHDMDFDEKVSTFKAWLAQTAPSFSVDIPENLSPDSAS